MKLSNITRYRWGKIAHNHSHPQPWFRRSQHVATDHTHKRSTQFPVLQQNLGNCQSTCSIHQCQCPHSRLEDISSLAEVALRDKKRTREEFWEQAIRVRSWSRLEWWSLTWKSWFWRWRCCLMQNVQLTLTWNFGDMFRKRVSRFLCCTGTMKLQPTTVICIFGVVSLFKRSSEALDLIIGEGHWGIIRDLSLRLSLNCRWTFLLHLSFQVTNNWVNGIGVEWIDTTGLNDIWQSYCKKPGFREKGIEVKRLATIVSGRMFQIFFSMAQQNACDLWWI